MQKIHVTRDTWRYIIRLGNNWRKIISGRFFLKTISQLHAVPRTQQVRQRKPNVKTLRSPLSAEFWRHCVLSGRTQPERRNENINVNKYFTSSSGDRIHNQSILQLHFVPLCHDWPLVNKSIIYIFCCSNIHSAFLITNFISLLPVNSVTYTRGSYHGIHTYYM